MSNFETYLTDQISKHKDCIIKDAMFYCIEGGKRFRPNIIFSILKGFNIDEEKGYACASALEYIQTYSLIHDDLPCMDNDDLRRGKPSCHIKYGEDIALLVGDSFLTHSFECITNCDEYDNELKSHLVGELCSLAGLNGMIYGQLLDVKETNITKEKINEVHENKTGGLFKYSCLAAMYIARNNDYEYFEELGRKIGILFQYQDDLFDVLKSEEETGKSNSDKDNNKFTAVNLFNSVDELKDYIEKLFNELYEYLDKAPFDSKYLKELIDKMKGR